MLIARRPVIRREQCRRWLVTVVAAAHHARAVCTTSPDTVRRAWVGDAAGIAHASPTFITPLLTRDRDVNARTNEPTKKHVRSRYILAEVIMSVTVIHKLPAQCIALQLLML